MECTFGWLGLYRRPARDYELLTQSLAAYHWVACIGIMLSQIQPVGSA